MRGSANLAKEQITLLDAVVNQCQTFSQPAQRSNVFRQKLSQHDHQPDLRHHYQTHRRHA